MNSTNTAMHKVKPIQHKITLVIYPNYRGMGYVICEHPKDIINYGIGRCHTLTPDHYVKRLKKFIDNYSPDVVILKYYQLDSKVVTKRVQNIIQKLENKAIQNGLEVYKYTRSDINYAFANFGTANKFDISRVLVQWYPYLKPFLAPQRTFIMPEHYRMGIFDAFALMYTHFNKKYEK